MPGKTVKQIFENQWKQIWSNQTRENISLTAFGKICLFHNLLQSSAHPPLGRQLRRRTTFRKHVCKRISLFWRGFNKLHNIQNIELMVKSS